MRNFITALMGLCRTMAATSHLTALALFCFGFASISTGANRYVDPASAAPAAPYTSPASAAHTIAPALAVCVSGDTVYVAAGTYVLTSQISIPGGVSLVCLSGPATATINGNNLSRCVNMASAGATLSGFTITGGMGAAGAGVYCVRGTVTNCVITANQAVGDTAQGGGIYGDGATISLCTISGNGCTSTNVNQFGAFAEGGGIYAVGGSQITRSTVTNNGLTGYYANGAGINTNNGSVQNCTISGNTAYGRWYANGGGIYMTGNAGGFIRNCLIAGNNAHADRGASSANWASGGGVYLNGGGTLESSTVSGNTLDGDTATGGGLTYGGLIRNTIIFGNTATARLSVTGPNYYLNPSGAATFEHCCSTPLPAGTGNIASNPSFAIGGYGLAIASPCADAGANQAWMAAATDLAGTNRIWNATVDIGAYETIPTGSLQVNITPAGAVSAGAQWQVDGGALQSSGATIPGLPIGSHTVTFSPVSGWATPTSQSVTVNANQTTIASGTYVITHTVTPSAGTNGGVSPSIVQNVTSSESLAFTALSDPGYTVNQWIVNGSAVQTGGTTYTVSNVTANTTVQVTFKLGPLATTAAASGVSSGWATMGGSGNPGGVASIAYFQYGTTTGYGSTTFSQPIGSGSAAVPVSFNVSGLARGTTYHYRLVVANADGTSPSYGADQIFTTPGAVSPAAWHTIQITANANMASGIRTGVAHASWYLYYYKGTDSNIWCVYWTGTQWSQAKLTTTANVDDWLTFHPAYGTLYYKGTDNNIWTCYWTGTQWAQVQLSATGNVAGDVVVDTGLNLVIYRGTDANLWVLQWNGTAWVVNPTGGTGNVAGSVSADSTWHLFYYRSADNNLWASYYSGGWIRVKLSTNANVGGSVTADAGGLVYYSSSVDGTAWATYWTGSAWAQAQLNSSAQMNAAPTMYAQYYPAYINPAGQCALIYISGGMWNTALLGSGGANLTGGLSVLRAKYWVFAGRSDGHIVWFYYQ